MLRLVAYDIVNRKRLRKIAKICEDFGVRIEYSVFESRLDDCGFSEFIERIKATVSHGDRVVVYPICRSCEGKILALGAARANADADSLVF